MMLTVNQWQEWWWWYNGNTRNNMVILSYNGNLSNNVGIVYVMGCTTRNQRGVWIRYGKSTFLIESTKPFSSRIMFLFLMALWWNTKPVSSNILEIDISNFNGLLYRQPSEFYLQISGVNPVTVPINQFWVWGISNEWPRLNKDSERYGNEVDS